MAIKHTKRKVAPKKDTSADIVIVGNYKTRQLDWIKKHGVYNWPVREEDGHAGRVTLPTDVCPTGDVDDAHGRGGAPRRPLDQELANVKELWLYANVKSERHVFTAQFVGKMTNAEFLAFFAGVGGFRIAMQRCGGKCVFVSDFKINVKGMLKWRQSA